MYVLQNPLYRYNMSRLGTILNDSIRSNVYLKICYYLCHFCAINGLAELSRLFLDAL